MATTESPPPPKDPKRQTMEQKKAAAYAELLLVGKRKVNRILHETTTEERRAKLDIAQLTRLDLWDSTYADLVERARAELRAWREACSRPALPGSGDRQGLPVARSGD